MLADEEVVEHARRNRWHGWAWPVGDGSRHAAEAGRSLTCWTKTTSRSTGTRSERFDTVIDFRFTQPANDAFARVIEHWINHFTGAECAGAAGATHRRRAAGHGTSAWMPRRRGCSTSCTNGESWRLTSRSAIIGLFRMDILGSAVRCIERARGKPVWLALAKTPPASW